MPKDVKLEIIYFKQNNDISLEFGLHGNYSLRILSSRAVDKKGFLSALKRAVSRSAIIISVGGFGADNIPSLISKAIGKEEKIISSKDFDFIDSTEHTIPADSIPLITSDGVYGGYLIESGPQTIICLTDKKNVRLDIVHELVVPYISEKSKNPAISYTGEIVSAAVENEGAKVEFEETVVSENIEQTETPAKEKVPVTVTFLDGAEKMVESPLLSDFSTKEAFPDNEKIMNAIKNTAEDPESCETCDVDIDITDNFFVKSSKEYKRKKIIITVICIVLILAIAVSSIFWAPPLAKKLLSLKSGASSSSLISSGTTEDEKIDYYEKLSATYYQNVNDNELLFSELHKINNKIVSWSTFGDDYLSAPIIFDAEKSADFYLTHLPDETQDVRGSLFVLSENNSTNTTIYGSLNGLFSCLDLYLGELFLTVNSEFKLSTPKESIKGTVKAAFYDNEFAEENYPAEFESDKEYKKFVEFLNEKAGKKIFSSKEKSDFVFLVGKADNSIIVAVVTVNDKENEQQETESQIQVGVNDENFEYADKDENPEQFEQTPIIPPNDEIIENTSSETTSTSSVEPSSSAAPPSSVVDPSSSSVISPPSSSNAPSSSVIAPSSSSTISSAESSSNTSSETVTDPIATGNITLSVKNNGSVVTGTAYEILCMIVEAEMGSGYPEEALKAQTVAAYSWLLNHGAHNGKTPTAPLKTPGSRVKKCVEAVLGERIFYNGKVATTYYYAMSAGYTADYYDVWGYYHYEYLQPVVSEYDYLEKKFETTVTKTASEIKSLIISKCGITPDEKDKANWFSVTYDKNDLYATYVTIAGKKYVGKWLRETFFDYGIRSHAYKISYDSATDSFTFVVKGYGHGVGMSQIGAKYYALKDGWDYKQIIQHYFKGTTVE